MLSVLGDKMLDEYPSRKAYQLNGDIIKRYITEGLSPKSQEILRITDRVMFSKPSTKERTPNENNLMVSK